MRGRNLCLDIQVSFVLCGELLLLLVPLLVHLLGASFFFFLTFLSLISVLWLPEGLLASFWSHNQSKTQENVDM